MATYNGERYLRPQLDSILKQLAPNDELIISDDGSTDSTIEIIESYKDKRIHILRSNHKNLILNFENALNHAKGDLIFLADQDDVWFNGKIEKCIKQLKNFALVFSNAAMFKGDDIHNFELFFKDGKRKTGLLSNLYKVNFLGATLAFRKSVLERALPFPRGIAMHDIWIGLNAEVIGNTYYIDEPLIYYRRHETNASSAGDKSKNSLVIKMKIRWQLLSALILRSIVNFPKSKSI